MIWYHVCIQYKPQMIWITLFWLFSHLIQRWYVFVLIHPNHVYLKFWTRFDFNYFIRNNFKITFSLSRTTPPPYTKGVLGGAMGFEPHLEKWWKGVQPIPVNSSFKKIPNVQNHIFIHNFFYQFHYNHNYVNFDIFKYCFI